MCVKESEVLNEVDVKVDQRKWVEQKAKTKTLTNPGTPTMLQHRLVFGNPSLLS